MAVAVARTRRSGLDHLGSFCASSAKPLVTAATQRRGKLLLDQILDKAAHPPAQARLDRIEPSLPGKQHRVR